MILRERMTIDAIGAKALEQEAEASRQAHEDSREYRENIGQYTKREERFKRELMAKFDMDDIDAGAIIDMFKNGTIKYKIYLGYPDIIRDRLQEIRQKKYTDV